MRTIEVMRRAMPGLSSYGLARVVVAVRAAVVMSIGGLLIAGPEWVRQYSTAVACILVAAVAYALVMLLHPSLEVRHTRYAWAVGALDAVITLTVVVLTGGAGSPIVSVLVLVIIAAAARLSAAEAILFTMLVAGAYMVVAVQTDPGRVNSLDPVLEGVWWALYLLFTGALVGALVMLTEREHHSRIRAIVEAEAEHEAAEEERDLRARLLQSYESQQDGLRVILHEFRTPVASLQSLARALTNEAAPMSVPDRSTSLHLANAHASHLREMLDALGDVALSRRPTFSSGHIRRVNIAELISAAANAVNLQEPTLQITVAGDASTARVDAQGLRRVLTNLLENASRHGRGAPIEVVCTSSDRELVISVLDRGPGIPSESLGELTAKFVSIGDQRGTAGLGLWIVQQIVDATGGRLDFASRVGGGMIATFRMPVG